MRDNGCTVGIVPALLTNTPQLREQIRQATPMLVPDVARINFEVGFDAMGFASIFFNIVLTDHASRPQRLRHAAQRIALILMEPPAHRRKRCSCPLQFQEPVRSGSNP